MLPFFQRKKNLKIRAIFVFTTHVSKAVKLVAEKVRKIQMILNLIHSKFSSQRIRQMRWFSSQRDQLLDELYSLQKAFTKSKKMWQPNQIYGKGDFPHSLGRGIWIIGGWEKGANLMNGPRDRVGLEMGREPSAPYTKKQS